MILKYDEIHGVATTEFPEFSVSTCPFCGKAASVVPVSSNCREGIDFFRFGCANYECFAPSFEFSVYRIDGASPEFKSEIEKWNRSNSCKMPVRFLVKNAEPGSMLWRVAMDYLDTYRHLLRNFLAGRDFDD